LGSGSDAVTSVSCSSDGPCSAGGYYYDGSAHQAFIADKTSGTWGLAQEVPNTGTLNVGGFAQIDSISCPSAGNCSAAGDYADSGGNTQFFVVDESTGTWSQAQTMPNIEALNLGGFGELLSLSCASAGNCSAGGYYSESSGNAQAFLIDAVAAPVPTTSTTSTSSSPPTTSETSTPVSAAASGSEGSPASLASTGADPVASGVIGGLLMASGALLLIPRYRRREQRS
jgi:LPXTG-motif cell wall-anchored protein